MSLYLCVYVKFSIFFMFMSLICCVFVTHLNILLTMISWVEGKVWWWETAWRRDRCGRWKARAGEISIIEQLSWYSAHHHQTSAFCLSSKIHFCCWTTTKHKKSLNFLHSSHLGPKLFLPHNREPDKNYLADFFLLRGSPATPL